MTHTNRASVHEHNGRTQRTATESSDLLLAFSQMPTGIKKPARLAWKFYDANRGRPVKPLGSFPDVADACIDAGGTQHFVEQPLRVAAAHIRRRFRGIRKAFSPDLSQALVVAQREESEADVSELNLALSCANPDTSVLLAFVKDKREEIVAEEHVVELAEDLLAAREQS